MINQPQQDIRHQDAICTNESELKHKWWFNLKYLVVGLVFGVIFVKAEIISWFRIQEMFKLQSFHMYLSLIHIYKKHTMVTCIPSSH